MLAAAGRPQRGVISVVTKSPVTIRDVARLAGVSVGTVSKALNGYGQLRAETRDAVRNAAERLGFRPNDLAQSLLRKRSFTVGLISTDSYGRFSIPVLEGIESALEPARLSVFLCRADDPVRERRHVDSLLAKRVDGIIVTGRRTDRRSPVDLGDAPVPVVYAFAQVADPRALCLLPDDRGGARLAVEHLIGLGRRRIAHVTGPVDFEAVRKRRQGFRDALAAAGLRGRPAMSSPARGAKPSAARPRSIWPAFVRRSTRSSAAATRSRAASSTACARPACACPTTSPWSASTTGMSSPPRRGRPSPRST